MPRLIPDILQRLKRIDFLKWPAPEQDIADAIVEIERLRTQTSAQQTALQRIWSLNPKHDTHCGMNEWGQAECFEKAQAIAQAALGIVL